MFCRATPKPILSRFYFYVQQSRSAESVSALTISRWYSPVACLTRYEIAGGMYTSNQVRFVNSRAMMLLLAAKLERHPRHSANNVPLPASPETSCHRNVLIVASVPFCQEQIQFQDIVKSPKHPLMRFPKALEFLEWGVAEDVGTKQGSRQLCTTYIA